MAPKAFWTSQLAKECHGPYWDPLGFQGLLAVGVLHRANSSKSDTIVLACMHTQAYPYLITSMESMLTA